MLMLTYIPKSTFGFMVWWLELISGGSDIKIKVNNHQMKAGGMGIGGLNRRLKDNASERRWFSPRANRPAAGLKPPYRVI